MNTVPQPDLRPAQPSAFDPANAALWAPPEAPLEMPVQRLEAPRARFSLLRLAQQLRPRQRV